MDREFSLEDNYSPSPPCNCDTCRSFCLRPGWWTIQQAIKAINKGYSQKMMLEVAPDFSFAVLSPAFKGCEGYIAINEFASAGCIFYSGGLCEIHASDIQPLECRVCHHESQGMGPKIHRELENEWNTKKGQKVVINWMKEIKFHDKLLKDKESQGKIIAL